MPAEQRGHVRKLPSGKVQLRYRDRAGVHHAAGVFASRSAALSHYRDVIEPELNGKPAARRDLTLRDLADVFLRRHATVAEPRTITTLRGRLSRPLDAFGDVPLAEVRTDDGRDRRVRYDAAGAIPLQRRVGAAADV